MQNFKNNQSDNNENICSERTSTSNADGCSIMVRSCLLGFSRFGHDQCWSTRVQYSYSSTTRVPFFEYSYSYSEPQVLGWYSYSKVNVLGTRSKKEPSTRVHLVFAKSNKQNEFLIVNCSQ